MPKHLHCMCGRLHAEWPGRTFTSPLQVEMPGCSSVAEPFSRSPSRADGSIHPPAARMLAGMSVRATRSRLCTVHWGGWNLYCCRWWNVPVKSLGWRRMTGSPPLAAISIQMSAGVACCFRCNVWTIERLGFPVTKGSRYDSYTD